MKNILPLLLCTLLGLASAADRFRPECDRGVVKCSTHHSVVKRCVKRKWEISHCLYGAMDTKDCICASALQGNVLNETLLKGRYARGLDVEWDEGIPEDGRAGI